MKVKICGIASGGVTALLVVWLSVLFSACGETPGITVEPTQAMETPTITLPPAPEVPATPVGLPSPSASAILELPSTPPPPSPPPTEPSPTPSPLPSSTTVPAPTRPPPDQVLVRETTTSILAYPYEPHLHEAFDEQHGVPYLWLDQAAYGEPSVEALAPRYFRAVVLENRYLRVTILPELGGRVYECIFKPTGQDVFYRNEVLKPTRWGPLAREENWWLAAGGMEWAFPVNEHGYEWGLPWVYWIEHSATETTVTLRDTIADRPRISVQVALAPGKAYFTVRPHIENPTSAATTYQYWTNAMLTLGSPSMSLNTEFIYPTQEIIIHSAGPNSGLPGEKSRIGWPLHQGRDIAWYRNWTDWLGFFVPEPNQDFVGAYSHDTDLGIARVFPGPEVPGVKLFAWGQDSPYAFNYTDDGSQYFEIWGGPNKTFWAEDDISLEPGESKTWTEYWYPFHGIEGLDFANHEAALSLESQQGSLHFGLATTSYQEGTIVLLLGEEELHRQGVAASPDSPYTHRVPLPAGAPATARVSLRFLGPDGQIMARYDEDMLFR